MTRASLLEAEAPCEWTRPAGRAGGSQGRLLSGYLHKTSNGLCGIKGYASLIARGHGPADRPEAWARKIIAEVEKLEVIYRSIQELAFPPEAAPAGGTLAGALRGVVAAATRRHANLRVALPPLPPARLLLPARDLALVVAEALANSAQSREGPVAVRVEAGRRGGSRWWVSLADDGPGMEAELLMQAAEPFVTTRAGHLGIGLARVDTIMDMHGLGWGLRSGPGAGTVVTLEIAAADAAPPTAKGRT